MLKIISVDMYQVRNTYLGVIARGFVFSWISVPAVISTKLFYISYINPVKPNKMLHFSEHLLESKFR